MIINDIHKFIFVHIPKSGGTSVNRVLRGLEGNNSSLVSQKTKHETLSGFYKEVGSRMNPPAAEMNLHFDSYFKFGFVRNPWDRISSLYSYLQEKHPRPEIKSIRTFEAFLESFDSGRKWISKLHSIRPQHEFFIDDNGKVAADFIGCYEFLDEGFNQVQKRFGLSLSLPHANKSSNSKKDYRSQYTDKLAEIVARKFAKDISIFGYKFDAREPALTPDFAITRTIASLNGGA